MDDTVFDVFVFMCTDGSITIKQNRRSWDMSLKEIHIMIL